nr:MAG: hypothetical protein [Microvirus sp.]
MTTYTENVDNALKEIETYLQKNVVDEKLRDLINKLEISINEYMSNY